MSENPTTETARIRVSTLELFFDLVFVFTITQLAETLYEHLTLATCIVTACTGSPPGTSPSGTGWS
jgi:low temperature requirement protein LtrA